MWHLSKIPKIAHFYWGPAKKLSFLQFMTVYTFWKLNPDWQIYIHTSNKHTAGITWKSKEQDYPTNYDDFSLKLGEIPVKYFYHDFKTYGLSNSLTEVHKSDIIRLKMLTLHGGLYSDMDVLYVKPMNELDCNVIDNKDKDTFVCICHYGHSIGFLMSSVHNIYYNKLYEMARHIASSTEISYLGYQQVGAPMINSKYKNIANIPGSVYNISMETVYPYTAQQIPELLGTTNKITSKTIGIHFFAGHPMIGQFLNATNGGLVRQNNILSNLLDNNYVSNSIDISKTYDSKRIFLMGPSGVGKTLFAKSYAKKNNITYWDFDLYFGIVSEGWKHLDEFKFIQSLPTTFITEFIPPNSTNIGTDAQIVYLCCSKKSELTARLNDKNMKLDEPYLKNLKFQYTERLAQLESCGYEIDYFDSSTNEFITKEEFLQRNLWVIKTEIV